MDWKSIFLYNGEIDLVKKCIGMGGEIIRYLVMLENFFLLCRFW